jgi:hypothetical protein
MKLLKKLHAFVLTGLVCGSLQAETSKHSVDFLFVGFDTGETYVWEEVIRDWDHARESGILAMATAAKIAKDLPVFTSVQEEHKFFLEDVDTHRLAELTEAQLEQVKALEANYVITGMYSKAQRQVAELFHQKNVPVIAFWDCPASYEHLPQDLMANVENIVQIADAVLVPSLEIAKDLNTRFTTGKAVVVGHPAIDLAVESIHTINTGKVKKKLPFSTQKPLVSYVGGYEENNNGYQAAFTLFLEGIKHLGSKVQLLVQLHPRASGDFEEKLLGQFAKENPDFPQYFLSSPFTELQAFEAVAVASLVATHRSTLGTQSFLAGKPVIYVDLPNTPFTNFSIEKGYSKQLTNAGALRDYVENNWETVPITDGYQQCAIPKDGTQNIRSFLIEKSAPKTN